MSEPMATWNRARGAWETPVLNLLCGHLEPFSQTWPKSGSMRNGSVFPQPVPGPAISAGASSSSHGLLPTPLVTNRAGMTPSPATEEGKRGTDLGPAIGSLLPTPTTATGRNARHGDTSRGDDLPEAVRYLPTPNATDAKGGAGTQRRGRPAGDMDLPEAVALLPTPRASANENRQTRRTPSQAAGDHGLCLAAEVLELLPGGVTESLLPTPRATDGTNGGPNQRGSSGDLMLPSAVVTLLPTPSVADGTGGHLTRSGDRGGELLLPGVVRELSGGMRQQSGGTSEFSGG